MSDSTRYMAVCDSCRQIHFFPTENARDFWQNNHPCEGDK